MLQSRLTKAHSFFESMDLKELIYTGIPASLRECRGKPSSGASAMLAMLLTSLASMMFCAARSLIAFAQAQLQSCAFWSWPPTM